MSQPTLGGGGDRFVDIRGTWRRWENVGGVIDAPSALQTAVMMARSGFPCRGRIATVHGTPCHMSDSRAYGLCQYLACRLMRGSCLHKNTEIISDYIIPAREFFFWSDCPMLCATPVDRFCRFSHPQPPPHGGCLIHLRLDFVAVFIRCHSGSPLEYSREMLRILEPQFVRHLADG